MQDVAMPHCDGGPAWPQDKHPHDVQPPSYLGWWLATLVPVTSFVPLGAVNAAEPDDGRAGELCLRATC